MEVITLTEEKKTDEEFTFSVEVGEKNPTDHEVTLKEKDFNRIAPEDVSAEELVRESFKFLLERERKESILSRFDLTEISTYFPDYEERIKEQLRS